MTDKCYLLSGLGADGSVFQYIDFEVEKSRFTFSACKVNIKPPVTPWL